MPFWPFVPSEYDQNCFKTVSNIKLISTMSMELCRESSSVFISAQTAKLQAPTLSLVSCFTIAFSNVRFITML